jgi:hypothetical protein
MLSSCSEEVEHCHVQTDLTTSIIFCDHFLLIFFDGQRNAFAAVYPLCISRLISLFYLLFFLLA